MGVGERTLGGHGQASRTRYEPTRESAMQAFARSWHRET
jgi:hypothetical protein